MNRHSKAIGNADKNKKDTNKMKISNKVKDDKINIYCIDCFHRCSQPVGIVVVKCCLKNRDKVSAV